MERQNNGSMGKCGRWVGAIIDSLISFLDGVFFGSLSLGVTNDISPTGRDLISHRISQGKEAMTKKVLDDDD